MKGGVKMEDITVEGLLIEAREQALKIPEDNHNKLHVWTRIIEITGDPKDLELFRQVVSAMVGDYYHQAIGLAIVASAREDMAMLKRALELANLIEKGYERSRVLYEIAPVFAKIGEIQRARELAAEIEEDIYRAMTWRAIARWTKAEEDVRAACKAARSFKTASLRAGLLLDLAEALK